MWGSCMAGLGGIGARFGGFGVSWELEGGLSDIGMSSCSIYEC